MKYVDLRGFEVFDGYIEVNELWVGIKVSMFGFEISSSVVN